MSKPDFKPILSPFGTTIDLDATIVAFRDYLGRTSSIDWLEKLAKICRDAHPMPKYPSGQYSRLEVFRMRAIRQDFTHQEIDGFLTFGG